MSLIDLTQTSVVLISIALGTLAFFSWRASSVGHKRISGPRGLPFIGNLHQIPALRPHPQCLKWAQEYGPIYRLRLGPQYAIFLNTAEAANELLLNRSRNYSSRTSPHMAQDLMSDGSRMLFLPYNQEFKAVRKSLKSHLGPSSSRNARPMQELESRVLLYDLMKYGNGRVHEKQMHSITISNADSHFVPEDHWFSIINKFATSIVMTVTYGKRVHKLVDNPQLHQIFDVMENIARVAQPGKYLADTFSFIRMLPDFLAPWRAEGKRMHIWEMRLWGGYLQDMKNEIQQGTEKDCYTSEYLKQRAATGKIDVPGRGLTEDGWLRDTLLAYTSGTILEAGTDTTSITMRTFILFMLNYPNVLRKLREEMDNVVGMDRMPDWDDEPELPYLTACIKESMRCRPAIPMGVPHCTDEDDVWNGYFIPKGTNVFGNVWAIHMDPNTYPDPTTFNPDRFLGKHAEGADSNDRDHYVFGWGRRFCPGSYIAEATLYIALSRLIWGLDFWPAADPITGKPIIPDVHSEESFGDGFATSPCMFNLNIRARSEKHAVMISRSYEDAQTEFQAMGLAKDERVE